ncbi:MAG TPA: hypothetical protein VLQ68_09605, partial [Rhizobiaceae bacterium]|nr:hypothetical protein [Rhizobiaceae bacterium]
GEGFFGLERIPTPQVLKRRTIIAGSAGVPSFQSKAATNRHFSEAERATFATTACRGWRTCAHARLEKEAIP